MNFTANAINLKSYNFNESDKIILMYSKEKGLIRVIAKGSNKIKSKLGGRTEVFVANKLMLYKGKSLDKICQAQSLNTFPSIRSNLDKLSYSIYCAEIIKNFGTEDDPNSNEIYKLFYDLLTAINQLSDKKDILLQVIKFQLKFMQIIGYGIELDSCISCGEEHKDKLNYFDIKLGGVICENCKTSSSFKFNNKLSQFLNTLLQFDFDKKTKYDDLSTLKINFFCFKLLKSYIEQFSDKKFKTTFFLEDI